MLLQLAEKHLQGCPMSSEQNFTISLGYTMLLPIWQAGHESGRRGRALPGKQTHHADGSHDYYVRFHLLGNFP